MSELVEWLRKQINRDESDARSWRKVRDRYGDPCPRCERPVYGYASPMSSNAVVRTVHTEGDGINDGCDLTRDEDATFFDGGLPEESERKLKQTKALRELVDDMADTLVNWSDAGEEVVAERALEHLADYYKHRSGYGDWRLKVTQL